MFAMFTISKFRNCRNFQSDFCNFVYTQNLAKPKPLIRALVIAERANVLALKSRTGLEPR